MDPFQVLQTAIAPSLDAMKSGADRSFAMAVRQSDQAREDAKTESDRLYNERLMERRRQQAKSDDEEKRRRELRNQLAALMPSGSVIPENMSEEEMSSQISNRTRMRAIEYAKEDKDRAFQFEIEKTKTLGEEQLKMKAEEFGVAWDPSNKAKVQNAIAVAAANQKLEIEATIAKQKIANARALPEYASLKKRLGDAIYERNVLMSSLAFPEPTFNAAISPQDRADIYNEIARMPEIIDKFSKFKDGVPRLMALQRGDFLSAVKGLKEEDRIGLASVLSENSGKLETRLLSDRSIEYQGGVKSYVERLRTLPQRLSEVDRRINDLYKTGDGTALDAGLALRFEDPDALLELSHDKARAGARDLNGMPSALPAHKPQALPSPNTLPSIPSPATQPSAQLPSAPTVPGVIPQAMSSAADYFSPAVNMFTRGVGNIAKSVDNTITRFGNDNRDAFVHWFGGTPSTNTPPPDLVSPVLGVHQIMQSPLELLQWRKQNQSPATNPSP
jgi:hypothetical protein